MRVVEGVMENLPPPPLTTRLVPVLGLSSLLFSVCLLSSIELFSVLELQVETGGIDAISVHGPVMIVGVVVGILRLHKHPLFSERHDV